MIYQNTLEFAESLDAQDELKAFRNEFLIPQHNGKDTIYLCGNSLGLQPVSTEKYLVSQLNSWRDLAVEGWFQGDDPWLSFHRQLKQPLADLTGATSEEITVMNSLTVNLHLMFVSFYKPTNNKYKILMESGAFPSDQYAVESQVVFHGFEPENAIIELYPREGELTLRTEDIISAIEQNADELALVLFGGVNYYTGQLFDMAAIAKAAHDTGAYAGFDLAHAVGNVPLKLHEWNADFACWCSYKYMNSGPGGISGIFVHEKHFDNPQLKRFAGWWGYRPDKRFLMAPGFDPAKGAEGWQVSTSPILLMAVHKAALDVFEKAGGLDKLRRKSILLTGYLEYLVQQINQKHSDQLFMIITPSNPNERGCQLSIVCKRNGKAIFNYLAHNGVIGDWREPDVIRLSPVPLYNSFKDVYEAVGHLAEALVVSE
ncbi:MAG: kynU [Mucilaginibacter sp.]|nr:kynU [Mucilaginibacter sp.]